MTSDEVTPPKRTAHKHAWQTLIEFDLSRGPGSERLAVDRVAEAVQRLNWPAAYLERLRLALVQAIRNTIERSHLYSSKAPLTIRVLIPKNGWATRAADQAGDEPTKLQEAERKAQQISQPPSRGWGFFMIEKARQDSGRDGQPLFELYLYPGDK